MDSTPRHDWQREEVEALFALPFPQLLHRAHEVHRAHFDPTEVQLSTLLSIKTGGCPEDCSYCPQAARYHTSVEAERLMRVEEVVAAAEAARAAGATRFCMGAAWRQPTDRQLDLVIDQVRAVKALGMETCVTLGMLSAQQASRLRDGGLDYYNHNLDTSEAFYPEVITTRTYKDRLETLEHVREAGISVCCGGIVGLGESVEDRAELLRTLANLPQHPESVPINMLVRVEGTPLAEAEAVDPIAFVRVVAVARILMPASWVRLSAGRETMSDEMHALVYYAGANSIFAGERLLTTPNPETDRDLRLLDRLGMRPKAASPHVPLEAQAATAPMSAPASCAGLSGRSPA